MIPSDVGVWPDFWEQDQIQQLERISPLWEALRTTEWLWDDHQSWEIVREIINGPEPCPEDIFYKIDDWTIAQWGNWGGIYDGYYSEYLYERQIITNEIPEWEEWEAIPREYREDNEQ